MSPFVVGVDVGTTSARAGVIDCETGRIISTATAPILVWNPRSDFYYHSAENIWSACCSAVNEAVTKAATTTSGFDLQQIVGLAFDATCSLVCCDCNEDVASRQPINLHCGSSQTTTTTTSDEQSSQLNFDVIVWMDHRAIKEADFINSTRHRVLDFVGGVISPEMQAPKLLWIKENLPHIWNNRSVKYFDLSDYLVYRATGVDVRSLCTTVCKWTYLAHEEPVIALDETMIGIGRWDDSFWRLIGLGDLVEDGYWRIGQRVEPMGNKVGTGLTSEAAFSLGLPRETAVSVAVIDAHAGGIGMIGARMPLDGMSAVADSNQSESLCGRLALICGTSSCIMAVSREPISVEGVWGPYFSAMIPNLWLNEGGISAAGKLIDHIVTSHPAYQQLLLTVQNSNQQQQQQQQQGLDPVFAALNARLEQMRINENLSDICYLTKELHVLPYFHGNRSPIADPHLKGAVIGLTLDSTNLEHLARIYLASIQSLAYNTRHIIDELEAKGHSIQSIFICGGLAKNPVFVQQHADICARPLVFSRETENMLLGCGILASVAASIYENVPMATDKMSHVQHVIQPKTTTTTAATTTTTEATTVKNDRLSSSLLLRQFHEKKYRVYREMTADAIKYRDLMKN